MRIRTLSLILLAPLATALARAEAELGSPEALWSTIPIVAWYGIPAKFSTPERYKEMADAGFTMCVPPDGKPTGRTQLDNAQAAGIKIILQDQATISAPASVAEEFKNHPALGMYFLRDEPNTGFFPKLRETKDVLARADPRHLGWINLYPNYATTEQMMASDYESYVDKFIAEVNPTFLSFDNYGFIQEKGKTTLQTSYYQNLETISKKAREKGIPFWAFALSTAHGGHETPSEGELRLQVFSNLAYGARGIQYFTYWTPLEPDGSFNFHDGPILQDGTRTPLLDTIAKVNRDIRVMTPFLLGLEAVDVQHVNSTDLGVKTFTAGHGLSSVRGTRTVLGYFTDKKGNPWVLVVNRDFELPSEVEISTASDIKSVKEANRKTGQLEEVKTGQSYERKTFTLSLEAGDGRLFQLSKYQ